MRRGTRSTRLGLAAVLVSVVVAGCGTTRAPGTATESTGPTRDGRSGSTAAPALDPAHAVDPPGPFQPPQHGADILVFSRDSLPADVIDRIKHLKGVSAVEPMALAQVSLENHAINLAAVDPATYRNFTDISSARLQEEWDRVAGGEVAISPSFKQQVPKDGWVRLGGSKDAPRAHVGAIAPQIPRVDAVVNTTYADTLGMKPDNALLVATGLASPQSVQKPIEKIAGSAASVQILGPDLDTSVQQTAFLVGTVADAVGSFSYTVLGGGHIAPQPSWVASHISTRVMPIIGPMTCNTLMFPQLEAALRDIVDRGLADKIHPSQYAGCYYPRFIAGTTTLSNHSFGLAFDLNVPENQRGTVGQMDRTVVSIFEKWGFTWGGTWSYTDPMHFEMNRLVSPR